MHPLVAKLHPLERQVLPALSTAHSLPELKKVTKLKDVEIMRALQWLENKKLITLKTTKEKIVQLGKNGLLYKDYGLPEKRFLRACDDQWKSLHIIGKKAQLDKQELNAALGLLKKEKAITLKKEETLVVQLSEAGQKLLTTTLPAEDFIDLVFPLNEKEIKDKNTYKTLLKRQDLLKIDEHTEVLATLTALGQELAKEDLQSTVLNRVTSKLLKSGEWKEKVFRSYDVEINVPALYPGKRHFVHQAVRYIKQIWLDLGFSEMTGDYVQSAFWDLDALFVPQDHPAREMQDTFYVEGTSTLPPLWKKIAKVHQDGADTNSTGWGYDFSEQETKRLLLRTHTTALSAQTLANLKKEDLPAKFFAVGKVFRNEALDWKHLFEFYQVEGIVVDPNANLAHLKGYLTQFYKKMGYEQVRMRPAHFPYTEPSLEVDVFDKNRNEWIELGGAGIFRPEVVIPLLGFWCPVLAWGQGMGRIIAEYWNITDIRDLYKNDIQQLREMHAWTK